MKKRHKTRQYNPLYSYEQDLNYYMRVAKVFGVKKLTYRAMAYYSLPSNEINDKIVDFYNNAFSDIIDLAPNFPKIIKEDGMYKNVPCFLYSIEDPDDRDYAYTPSECEKINEKLYDNTKYLTAKKIMIDSQLVLSSYEALMTSISAHNEIDLDTSFCVSKLDIALTSTIILYFIRRYQIDILNRLGIKNNPDLSFEEILFKEVYTDTTILRNKIKSIYTDIAPKAWMLGVSSHPFMLYDIYQTLYKYIEDIMNLTMMIISKHYSSEKEEFYVGDTGIFKLFYTTISSLSHSSGPSANRFTLHKMYMSRLDSFSKPCARDVYFIPRDAVPGDLRHIFEKRQQFLFKEDFALIEDLYRIHKENIEKNDIAKLASDPFEIFSFKHFNGELRIFMLDSFYNRADIQNRQFPVNCIMEQIAKSYQDYIIREMEVYLSEYDMEKYNLPDMSNMLMEIDPPYYGGNYTPTTIDIVMSHRGTDLDKYHKLNNVISEIGRRWIDNYNDELPSMIGKILYKTREKVLEYLSEAKYPELIVGRISKAMDPIFRKEASDLIPQMYDIINEGDKAPPNQITEFMYDMISKFEEFIINELKYQTEVWKHDNILEILERFFSVNSLNKFPFIDIITTHKPAFNIFMELLIDQLVAKMPIRVEWYHICEVKGEDLIQYSNKDDFIKMIFWRYIRTCFKMDSIQDKLVNYYNFYRQAIKTEEYNKVASIKHSGRNTLISNKVGNFIHYCIGGVNKSVYNYYKDNTDHYIPFSTLDIHPNKYYTIPVEFVSMDTISDCMNLEKTVAKFYLDKLDNYSNGTFDLSAKPDELVRYDKYFANDLLHEKDFINTNDISDVILRIFDNIIGDMYALGCNSNIIYVSHPAAILTYKNTAEQINASYLYTTYTRLLVDIDPSNVKENKSHAFDRSYYTLKDLVSTLKYSFKVAMINIGITEKNGISTDLIKILLKLHDIYIKDFINVSKISDYFIGAGMKTEDFHGNADKLDYLKDYDYSLASEIMYIADTALLANQANNIDITDYFNKLREAEKSSGIRLYTKIIIEDSEKIVKKILNKEK